MGKMKISTDRIIGISAMVISLLTLLIFMYQTRLVHEQSRLSVMPRMSFNDAQSLKDSIVTVSVTLKNKGLGPANIESIQIKGKNGLVPLNIRKHIESEFPELLDVVQLELSSAFGRGSTFSAGEESVLYKIVFHLRDIGRVLEILEIEADQNAFEIEVVYSSMYGQKWKETTYSSGPPVEL